MISRTATRTKIIPSRQQRWSGLNRPKTSAIDHAVGVVHKVYCLAGAASLIDDNRADLGAEGIPAAIRRHDTATFFDWLTSALSSPASFFARPSFQYILPIPVLRFRHSLFQTFANPQNPQNAQRGNTTLSGLLIYVKAERIASSLL